MIDAHIIPECYIDTKLIKGIVPPKTRYDHTKGCSTATKKMQKKFDHDFALGIVDRDKRQVDYANEFYLVTEIGNKLQLLKTIANIIT